MKKIMIAGCLLAVAGFANAGLLDSVTDTANAISSSKASGSSTDQAVQALLKTKFQENVTTKTQVKTKLGEPKATSTEDSMDVWTYDINSVNGKLGAAAGIAKALGANTSKADQVVVFKFEGETLKSYALEAAQG